MGGVFWVVFLVVVLVLLSAAIVTAVALPHLRAGSQVLTPQGERLVREARDRLNLPR